MQIWKYSLPNIVFRDNFDPAPCSSLNQKTTCVSQKTKQQNLWTLKEGADKNNILSNSSQAKTMRQSFRCTLSIYKASLSIFISGAFFSSN